MKNDHRQITGLALLGKDFTPVPVDIFLENGLITSIEDNPKAPPVWICPALFNAHTHLGDTVAMDCRASGSLEELVTPPDGLKHRLLRTAPRQDLVAGMRASIELMMAGGIAGCADFREGGADGVRALDEAAAGLRFRTYAFGRDGGEAIAPGLGISSARDVPGTENLVREAKHAGKKVAFHAGERDSRDVDAALSYEPDLLIHMTHATKRQLRYCAEAGIAIAVCPRSNWQLGVASSRHHPPLALMLDLGCTLYLGTDNVMFVPPDLFSEMAFVSLVYGLRPETILRAAVGGSELAGTGYFIREGVRANLFCIDTTRSNLRFSRDPLVSLTKRAYPAIIGTNVFNL